MGPFVWYHFVFVFLLYMNIGVMVGRNLSVERILRSSTSIPDIIPNHSATMNKALNIYALSYREC